MTPLFPTLRVVGSTAGARFVERAVPLYVGMLLAATVAFGPNGADPRDVVRLLAVSPVARVATWSAWLLLVTPLAGVLLRDRRADFLRSLPVSRPLQAASFAVWLLAAQAPWALLFTAGAGLAAGARAALLAAALSALLAVRPTGAIGGLAVGAALVAVVVDASALATFVLAPLLTVAVHGAWERAPERPALAGSWVRGPAVVALGLSHALRLARVERVTLLRGLLAAAFGGAFSALVTKNGDHLGGPHAAGVFLAVATLPLVVGAGGVAAPLREAQRALGALLASLCVPTLVRRSALGLAAGVTGVALGGVAFVAARWVAPVPGSLGLTTPLLGAALVPLAVALELGLRRAKPRAKQRDEGGRVALGLVALAALTIALSTLWGEVVVLVLGAAGVVASLAGAARRAQGTRDGPADALLELSCVSKRFGGKEVLRGVSLRVDRGEVVVLRGENGSGKSTLLRVAAGLLTPDAGEVRVLAAPPRALGYAPDAGELPEHLSVGELLALVSALSKGAVSHAEDRERLGVTGLEGARLSTLSLGQRRRVSLASALVGRPPLLLLDEPTNGLDAGGLLVLGELLGEQRARGGALVASHEAEFAARVGTRVAEMA